MANVAVNWSQTLSTWFAYPAHLALLAMVPLVALCFVVGYWGRRRALARLGSPLTVRRLTVVWPAGRRWRALCVLNGLALLALACAGPQWGKQPGQARGVRGDIV